MTSKIKIDVAKIKAERQQYADKIELYKKCKAKQEKVKPLIKFDELKKFHELEQIISEPCIPVEEYEDPEGLCILNPEQYQSIWNAVSAVKRTTYRRGQSNLKISNILNYSDYTGEEKDMIGTNLLNLMSVSPEHTSDCVNILDQWVFEWHPTFLQVCILFENLGCNVRKHVGSKYHIPEHYEVTIIKTKVDYEEFNSKSSNKQLELNTECLKNVLMYLKTIIGNFSVEEIQSILVVLSIMSLDAHCLQLTEQFSELVNKCFGCLENTSTENLLNTLYIMIENSMYQCYFVNNILNPCNAQCKPFAVQLSYLFMCNLLFNNEFIVGSTSLNRSTNNNNQNDVQSGNQRSLRSKRKLVDCKEEVVHIQVPKKQQHDIGDLFRPSPKKLLLEKAKQLLKKENTKLNFEKTKIISKSGRKGRGKKKLNLSSENDKQKQKSLLDYWKVREKSPDLSQTATIQILPSPKKPSRDEDNECKSNKALLGIGASVSQEQTAIKMRDSQELISTNLTEDTTGETDSSDNETVPADTSCSQRELIFFRYKNDSVNFLKLHQRIRSALQNHLDYPVRIYRTVNLLNNVVKLIRIDEENMSLCKLLIQELSHVQYKYYGLHDLHRHLVCVYLQHYTTVWGTDINRIQYRISQRNEESSGSD